MSLELLVVLMCAGVYSSLARIYRFAKHSEALNVDPEALYNALLAQAAELLEPDLRYALVARLARQ